MFYKIVTIDAEHRAQTVERSTFTSEARVQLPALVACVVMLSMPFIPRNPSLLFRTT